MPTPHARLRTDAAHNVERIVSAAQRVFTRKGATCAMEDVASEAGVGIATVYRRFATKESLVRTVLERRFADVVDNAIQRAQFESDARQSMRIALEGAIRFIVDDPNTIDAAANSGVMTMDMAHQFFEPVGNLLRRGQDADVFRNDLVAADIPRIVLMLAGTLVSFDRGADGWCRYVDLVLDVMCETRTGLSAPSAVRAHGPSGLAALAT